MHYSDVHGVTDNHTGHQIQEQRKLVGPTLVLAFPQADSLSEL